jgi:hypothetical protein
MLSEEERRRNLATSSFLFRCAGCGAWAGDGWDLDDDGNCENCIEEEWKDWPPS